MAGCEGELGGAFGLRGLGDDGGDFVEGLVDVGAEAGGVEDYVQLAVGDYAAAVVELWGCGEGNDVGGADRVHFVFAGLAVGVDVALELVGGAVYVAIDRKVSFLGRE